MTNLQPLTKLINSRASVKEIRRELTSQIVSSKLRVSKTGYEMLLKDLETDFLNSEFFKNYKGSKEFDKESFASVIYMTLETLATNIGNYKRGDVREGKEYLTWHPSNSYENSSQSLYTVANALNYLQSVGLLRKIYNSEFYYEHSELNSCAKYYLNESLASKYLDNGSEEIFVTIPIKIRRRMCSILQNYTDYEVIIFASSLVISPDNRAVAKAKRRLKLQAQLNERSHRGEVSGEEYQEETKKLDEKEKLSIVDARIIYTLYKGDIFTFMTIKTDLYAGRLYHKWSTVNKEIRDKAILRHELSKKNLVEIDLSQCNFYILVNRFIKETKYSPTKALAILIKFGKLREGIAIAARGTYEDCINGKEININFNEITNLTQAKAYKEQLKLFTLKAANCKKGSKAATILDEALKRIDCRFASWLSNLRTGWTKEARKVEGVTIQGNGKQSKAPFLTQQHEVEFMFGRKLVHDIPIADQIIRDTRCHFEYSKTPGIIENCINEGVRVLLPIHDAIICLKEDVDLVLKAIVKAARARRYLLPAFKVEEGANITKYVGHLGYPSQASLCFSEGPEFMSFPDAGTSKLRTAIKEVIRNLYKTKVHYY